MRTYGNRWPSYAPRGDYLTTCSICGTTWRRSQMRRTKGGLLRCPDDQQGRETAETDEANLAWKLHMGRPKPPTDYGGGLP
jgi:hypothetical protein